MLAVTTRDRQLRIVGWPLEASRIKNAPLLDTSRGGIPVSSGAKQAIGTLAQRFEEEVSPLQAIVLVVAELSPWDAFKG